LSNPVSAAIPRTGVHPLSPSFDHVGFFARRVDDVDLALSLQAGASDSDPHGRTIPGFCVDPDRGLRPTNRPRLALVRFEEWTKAEPEQQQVFEAAVAKLRDAGVVLQEFELRELDQANWNAVSSIPASEAALIFEDLVGHYPDRTSDRLKWCFEI
jgi:Asp-tRNA(Asn)/Glu-tRNA(Gln) amidotransferase A subunit family amidase